MPAPTVNLSIASVSGTSPKGASAGSATASGGGDGRSFGDWMQQLSQSSSHAKDVRQDGQRLPPEGKGLPAQSGESGRVKSSAREDEGADSQGGRVDARDNAASGPVSSSGSAQERQKASKTSTGSEHRNDGQVQKAKSQRESRDRDVESLKDVDGGSVASSDSEAAAEEGRDVRFSELHSVLPATLPSGEGAAVAEGGRDVRNQRESGSEAGLGAKEQSAQNASRGAVAEEGSPASGDESKAQMRVAQLIGQRESDSAASSLQASQGNAGLGSSRFLDAGVQNKSGDARAERTSAELQGSSLSGQSESKDRDLGVQNPSSGTGQSRSFTQETAAESAPPTASVSKRGQEVTGSTGGKLRQAGDSPAGAGMADSHPDGASRLVGNGDAVNVSGRQPNVSVTPKRNDTPSEPAHDARSSSIDRLNRDLAVNMGGSASGEGSMGSASPNSGTTAEGAQPNIDVGQKRDGSNKPAGAVVDQEVPGVARGRSAAASQESTLNSGFVEARSGAMSPQNDTQVSQSPATSEQVQRSAYDADVKASENVAAEDARRIVSERESAERLESSQREEQARQGRPDIVPVPGGVRSSADGENRQAQRSLQDADVAVGAVTGERSQSARDTLVNRQERVTQTQGILNQASEGHEAAQRNQNAAGTQTGSRQSGDVSMSGAASSAQILSTENEGDAPVNHQTNRTVSSLSGETKQINESTASAVQQQSSVPTATPRSDAAAGAMAIAQRLQDPAWGRAMGQRAVMMAQYGPRSAEIQLDPPELGAMQIRVHIGHGDQVSVTFTSPNAAVRDALEQQMPRLREMFSEQGLDLNQSTVSDQSTRERNDDSPDRRGGGRGGQYAGDEGAADVPATAQSVPVGLVDYYA